MPFSLQNNERNAGTKEDVPRIGVNQQKQDALDLAQLIYDIFKDSVSSVSIGSNIVSGKDEQNA